MKKVVLFSIFLIAIIALTANAGTITSVASGNWSDAATWDNGVPGAGDDVVIDTSNSVIIDISNAECNNLTIYGKLYFDVTKDGNGISIYGNVIVDATARFRMSSSSTQTINSTQHVTFYGDLTVVPGGTFDMRQGSGGLYAVGRVVFAGSTNSTINLSLTTYTSSGEEFNSIEINKTGGAKVILGSGTLFMSNNTTNAADTLIMTSGIIETGSNIWVTLRTHDQAIMGASSLSYIVGNIGRGITNSGGNNTKEFPVGDSESFRPISLRFIAPANSTGHYVWVNLTSGNANTGSSSFSGSIDKVSELRYYEVGYQGGSPSMAIYGFDPTYQADDGVTAGNTDLRVAYSTDDRATWVDAGPTDQVTSLPDTLVSDSLTTSVTVNSGSNMFVSLARLTGTTTNSLGAPTAVDNIKGQIPTSYDLLQNFPNPFNPSTKISYILPKSGYVKLSVYNIIGKEVTSLVDGFVNAGFHEVEFNASNLASGIYFYTIKSEGFTKTMKMVLMK